MRRIPVVLALFLSVLLPLGAADTAAAAPCTNPQFVTSDENGMWSDGAYIVHNNMWNVSGYDVHRDPLRLLAPELEGDGDRGQLQR